VRSAIHALTVLLSAAAAWAQPPGFAPTRDPYELQSWSIRSGLPQNDVSCIYQTSDGRLWITTSGGLARFDGTRFEIFNLSSDLGLRSNRLTSLSESSDGSIWIGTDGEGLIRRKDGDYSRISTDSGLPSPNVSCLVEGQDGRLWVGTHGGLAWLEDGQARTVDGLRQRIRDVSETADGTLWVAADDCLATVQGDGVVTKLVEGPHLSVHAAADGRVWAGRTAGQIEVHGDTATAPQITLPSRSDVRAITEDADGGIWFGSSAPPLRWANGRFEDPFHRFDFPLPAIVDVEVAIHDREGNIWFGGRGGLQRMRPTPFTGVRLPQIYGGSPRTIVADHDGRLWIALQHGTVLTYQDGEFRQITGDNGPTARALALSRDGAVWALSDDSLHKISDDGETIARVDVELSGDNNLAILEDRSGHLWFSSAARLYRRAPSGEVEVVLDHASDTSNGFILSLLESRSGDLWVGSDNRLTRIRGGQQRIWQADGTQLPAGMVRSLHEDFDGNIWLGTYGGGMCRITADGDTSILGTGHGLYEGVVTRIVDCGPGQVVLQGNRALSVISIQDLNDVADGKRARVYPRVFKEGPGIELFEGMGGSSPLVCRLDGSLWFPALESLVRFDPSALAPIATPPRPIIASVEVDGIPYEEDDRFRPRFTREGGAASFVIPPGTHNLTINFTAATFVNSDRTRFMYKLDGYDSDWVEAKRRAAVYTHVPPGPYRFSVMAAHPGGDWNPESTAISLEFEPWWYEVPAVQVGLAALLLAIIAGSMFSRSRRLRSQAEEMAELVAVRTSELEREIVVRRRTEDRLREARDQLEYKRETLEHELRDAQKFEALGHLAGKLAHDFNNILTAIMGQADLVLLCLDDAADKDGTQREGLSTIKAASERAARLVQQLLAYARQQILKPQTIDPNHTIREFREILRRLTREDIELRLHLGSDTGWIHVDPGQLEQVIMNLVVNASDASERGQVTIETANADVDAGFVERHPDAKPGPHVTIAVSDTGVGISEDNIDRIFDPFFTTKVEGTGLGLASVHGIVAQSGGFIHVSSTPGAGSTFTVFLPEAAAPTGAKAAAKPVAATPSGEATILVCDDESAIRDVAARVLENSGYRVLVAETPNRAIELYELHSESIDLLITDLVMPEMHGTDLASRLRDMRRGLKVLYISGYSREAATAGADEAATHFLHKPFNADTLIRHVEDVLAEAAD